MSTYKMALVVRTDLEMGKGKIAAQVAHAAVLLTIWTTPDQLKRVREWIQDTPSQTKVVLKAESQEILEGLARACDDLDIPQILVRDAGHTQVEPGTITVLGIGPDTSDRIDKITGGLKLL